MSTQKMGFAKGRPTQPKPPIILSKVVISPKILSSSFTDSVGVPRFRLFARFTGSLRRRLTETGAIKLAGWGEYGGE